MKNRSNLVGLLVLAAAPLAHANLLVDPGFEVNPLDTIANVITNFPAYQGVWGVEAATITGVDGAVTPAQGFKMLRMTDDFNAATQAAQMTDVSSFSTLINSGLAVVNLGGLFNADISGAVGGVNISFFSGPSFGSPIGGPIISNINLDSNPLSWESASLSVPVPLGTTWIMSQVAYSNVTLQGHPGYVDSTYLRIVPTPASASLLALAGGVGIRRRRR